MRLADDVRHLDESCFFEKSICSIKETCDWRRGNHGSFYAVDGFIAHRDGFNFFHGVVSSLANTRALFLSSIPSFFGDDVLRPEGKGSALKGALFIDRALAVFEENAVPVIFLDVLKTDTFANEFGIFLDEGFSVEP